MNPRFDDCTLAVIAGGRGSRLGGVVKAHLRLPDGRTLLDRLTTLFAPIVDEVLVVANDPSRFPDHGVIGDLVAGRGAPGGVHAACAAAKTEWVLALASDLPCVTPAVVAPLWMARQNADAIIPMVGGHLQPLVALYRARACAEAFGARLRETSLSFAELVADIRLRVVEEKEFREIDPALCGFLNVNSIHDLEQAELRLPGDNSSHVR